MLEIESLNALSNGQITLNELIALLQSAVSNGVNGDLPVAVCSAWNPLKEYWLLEQSTTVVRVQDDIAIVTY